MPSHNIKQNEVSYGDSEDELWKVLYEGGGG